MASVHFYLKGALKHEAEAQLKKNNIKDYQDYLDNKLQIYCSLSTANTRLKVYTKKRIQLKLWDSKKERANTKLFKKDGVILNDFLNELQSEAERLGEQNENEGIVTSLPELRNLIKPKKAMEKAAQRKVDFNERFKTFVSEHKTKKGFPLRENTLKKYNGFRRYVEEFAEARRIPLELDRIEVDTLSAFQTFLNEKKEMCDSTKAKYIKGFITFIKFYQKRGLIKHFDTSEVKVTEPEGETYVLPLQRLIQLQRTLFKSKRLAEVRDQFCFMCWTGQRFSDYLVMKRNNLIKDEFGKLVWKLSAIKITHGKLLSVPIIEYAQEILNRYKKGSLPVPAMSNQKFNDALKEMGKEARLNFEVRTIRYYNGIAKTNTVPFYEVLSAHVGRKTYITNSLILGVPERIVRDISGHKDEKSFRRYVKLADSYKTAVIHYAFNKANVKRVLNRIGNYEKYSVEAA